MLSDDYYQDTHPHTHVTRNQKEKNCESSSSVLQRPVIQVSVNIRVGKEESCRDRLYPEDVYQATFEDTEEEEIDYSPNPTTTKQVVEEEEEYTDDIDYEKLKLSLFMEPLDSRVIQEHLSEDPRKKKKKRKNTRKSHNKKTTMTQQGTIEYFGGSLDLEDHENPNNRKSNGDNPKEDGSTLLNLSNLNGNNNSISVDHFGSGGSSIKKIQVSSSNDDDMMISFRPLLMTKGNKDESNDPRQIRLPYEDEFCNRCPVKFFTIQLEAIRWMHWIESSRKPNNSILLESDRLNDASSLTYANHLSLQHQNEEERDDVLTTDCYGSIFRRNAHHQQLSFTTPSTQHVGGILGDVMGLGKTVDALGITCYDYFDHTLSELYQKRPQRPTLVITMLTLVHQWMSELVDKFKYPTTIAIIYHGPKRFETFQQMKDSGFPPLILITNYETVQSDFSHPEKSPLFTNHWERILMDEAHVARNPKTRIYRALKSLSSNSKWCITGTPIVNTPDDIRRLSQLCTPHCPLYCGSSLQESRWKSLFFLRRTKDILSLPTLTKRDVWLDWSANERIAYARLEKWAQEVYDELVSTKTLNLKYQRILLVLVRLRQACDHLKLCRGHVHTSKILEKVKSEIAASSTCKEKLASSSSTTILTSHTTTTTTTSSSSSSSFPIVDSDITIPTALDRSLPSFLENDDDVSCADADEISKISILDDSVGVACDREESSSYDVFSDVHQKESNDLENGNALTTTITTRYKTKRGRKRQQQSVNQGDDQEVPDPLNISIRNTDGKSSRKKQKKTNNNNKTDTNKRKKNYDCIDLTVSENEQDGIFLDELDFATPIDGNNDNVSIANTVGSSTKLLYTIDFLKNLFQSEDTTSKVVIFTQFTTMLDLLEVALLREGMLTLRFDGRVQKTDVRKNIIQLFTSSPQHRIIIASLKAGGVGLNLVVANHMIFIDPWWNSSVELQAFDRVHRIGQKKPVFVYRLLMRGSIEEEVLRIQEKKNNQENSFYDMEKEKVLSIKDIHCVFSTIRVRQQKNNKLK